MNHRLLGFAAVAVSVTLGALAPACSSSSPGTGSGGSKSSSSGTSGNMTSSSTSSTSSTSGTGGTGGATSSSSGALDGGDGGEGGPPANDTCATAEVHPLTVGGSPLTVMGTTVGSVTNFTGSCGATTNGVVYQITTTVEGTLTLTVTPSANSTLSPVVYQETTCGTSGPCFQLSTSQTQVNEDLPAGTYYFIVAGANGTSGAFTLTATDAAPKCGDGAVNTGEQCDLGTLPSAQWQAAGCYPPGSAQQCKTVPAQVIESTCPGLQILIPAGTSNKNMDPNGTIVGYPQTYSGSCNQQGTCPSCPGPSRVYQLTPKVSGTMTVSIGYQTDGVTTSCNADMNSAACWDMTLFVRTTCATSTSEIPTSGSTVGCSDPADPNAAIIKFPVVGGTSYYVFVVGYNDGQYGSGPYNLFVTLQ